MTDAARPVRPAAPLGPRSTVDGGFYPAGSFPAGGAPEGTGLKERLRLLYRRRALILACVLVVTMVATVLAQQRTPQYTAAAQVLIRPPEPRILEHAEVVERPERDVAALETEIKLIRSRSHARLVVERLGRNVGHDWAARPGSALSALASAPLRWLGERLPPGWLVAAGWADQGDAGQGPVPPPAAELQERLVDAYLGRLAVRQDGRAHILEIGFTSPDPADAARIANATAQAYVEARAEARRQATLEAHGWLDARILELRGQVEAAERAIARFRAEHDVAGAGSGASLGDSQQADLVRQLLQARAERAEREAKLRQVRAVEARGEGLLAVSEVLGSTVVQTLRREEATLVREEAQLAMELGGRHPRILRLRAELDNLKGKIAGEIHTVVRNLENEVAVVRSREEALQASLEEARAVSAEARQREVQLRELERRAETTRGLYETYLARRAEVQEQARLVGPVAQVIGEARPPAVPSSIGPGRIAAGGFALSLLLGVALAHLVERLDSGVRTRHRVEELLGVPCLGLVPKVKGGSGRPLHQDLDARPMSAFAEAVRVVLTGLDLADVDSPPRVVAVTSSMAGEGKTTLAASLAAAAARAGRRVVLVDLDLRRPVVHTHLTGTPTSGVVELMADEARLEDTVVTDLQLPGLHFLPVCRRTASPSELIGSRKMRALIDELRRRYDFVVIDTTPALGLSDARVAARLADKVLFVVQWERTNEEVALAGMQALLDARAEIAGAVLTQVDVRRHAGYAYGDVGHYYGRYRPHHPE